MDDDDDNDNDGHDDFDDEEDYDDDKEDYDDDDDDDDDKLISCLGAYAILQLWGGRANCFYLGVGSIACHFVFIFCFLPWD